MSNLAMRKALERISTYPRDRKDELSAASMRQIAREALDRPIDAVSESIEVPLGAIHNGRVFIDRIQNYGFECQGGPLENSGDWQQLVSCFEHLSEWAESQDSDTTLPESYAVVSKELTKDADRYLWLKSRMAGVDFDWGDEGMTALAFEMPSNVSFCADCDKNIDSAMLEAAKEVQS